MDKISLSIFSSRLSAICDEIGAMLQRAALSPNIKDRLDYSCAVFDVNGELCAQAAHIPVHLGSMAYAMQGIVANVDWQANSMIVLNDPYMGGTHLPDVTMIAPVFVDAELVGFVVNRAHHADIGAATAGSMPVSRTLLEEGIVIPPTVLVEGGEVDEPVLSSFLERLHNPVQGRGDFLAQISANRVGAERLLGLISGMSVAIYREGLTALQEYAEQLALQALQTVPQGRYVFTDVLDDDGFGALDIPVQVTLTIEAQTVSVDFTGTGSQVAGNLNCPLSVAAAAVFYVFRCLLPDYAPACAGIFRPVRLSAPRGCLVNAERPAAVAAGNVETSMRIVDAVMGALAQAVPERLAAAGTGSMNNVAMGRRTVSGRRWDYYETIGGGMGASYQAAGLSGVQNHMTNTLNTPIESLEMHYPLRVRRYALRTESGGAGQHPGGMGLVREFEFLEAAEVTVLTERRRHAPWGLAGGMSGRVGVNRLNGENMAAKSLMQVKAGDILTIETAGGGGWGPAED